MEDDPFIVLNAGEIELYVQSLMPSKIEDLGSERWLEMHQHMQKLSQQAVLEASENREEVVKDCLISYSKLCVLVHEAICISVWREKVFPEVLRAEEKPQDTFLIYMVLFHEATAVSLLETVLFHSDSCEALQDSSLDLLDYCIAAVLRVVSGYKKTEDLQSKPTAENIKDQELLIGFDIGIRCISLLQYLIESVSSLPLSVGSRMYMQHDVPLLLTHLLEERPWEKDNPKLPGQKLKYTDGHWMEVVGEDSFKLTRSEGHVWLALRQLLLREACLQYYEITDFRRSQLQKTLRYLTDPLLDQVPPLIDLKHFLCQLQMSSGTSSSRRPVVLEMIPQIRQGLLESGFRKWKKIAHRHVQSMFHSDQDCMQRMAESLSNTYDLNVIERLSGDTPRCAECGEPASKRCSRCKVDWYCGRECQVKNWTKHKEVCNSVAGCEESSGGKV